MTLRRTCPKGPDKDRPVERQGAAVRLLACYWDGWHAAFPALHKRGHWHIMHHLCAQAVAGAPLGELLGLARQALLVDDATARERIVELLAGGQCITVPPGAPLSARIMLARAPGTAERYDATLLTLRNALVDIAPILQPGLAVPTVPALTAADRALAADMLGALTAAWSGLLDALCGGAISPARRVDMRRHLLSTSHRTLLLCVIAHHYATVAPSPAGILADRMAAILLDRTGQNFQTTRDHIAALVAAGVLNRRPGRALSVGLATASVPAVNAAMTRLASHLAAAMQAAAGPVEGGHALRVHMPGETPRILPIQSFPFTIGRTDDNHLRLAAADISRVHCRIDAAAGGVLITDLGSTNGTAVNGRRITGPTPLQDGAAITLGPFELVFLAPADTQDATLRHRSRALSAVNDA